MLYSCYCIYLRILLSNTIRWCSCRLAVIRRVSLVEQELITLTEHMSSPLVVSVIRVVRYLFYCVVFCKLLFVILWLFCLSISYLRLVIYPFGIFKLEPTSIDFLLVKECIYCMIAYRIYIYIYHIRSYYSCIFKYCTNGHISWADCN